jgi:type II secretory pathway pseudopilin PulG
MKGVGMNTNLKRFTLIELMIVIAVVALLIALLFPALRRAKELAYTASCMSNLRQFAIMNANYMAEYNGYLPTQGWSYGHMDYVNVFRCFSDAKYGPYYGKKYDVPGTEIKVCPSFKRYFSSSSLPAPHITDNRFGYYTSTLLGGSWAHDLPGGPGWSNPKTEYTTYAVGPYQIGQIMNPARKYFMTERAGEWQFVFGAARIGHYAQIVPACGGISNYDGKGITIFPVHNRRVPTSFIDAHVEAIPGPIVGPNGPDGYKPLLPGI